MDYLLYIFESIYMFFWWLDDWGVFIDYCYMDGYIVYIFKVFVLN